MHTARIDGVALHYALQGPAGAPVLALSNSLGTDLRLWDALAERLGGGLRLLRYDDRGHGLSDAPPGPYSIEQHAAGLVGLLDRLEIASAAICGLSVGGLVAQWIAAQRPERVSALVLCDTDCRIGSHAAWQSRIDSVREGGLAAIADAVLERWFSESYRREQPDALTGWRNMLLRTPVEGYLGTCAALRDADLCERAASIRTPTLCLCGSEDRATTPAQVRELAARISGARYEELPGAGHLPCVECPQRLADAIGGFLEGGGRG